MTIKSNIYDQMVQKVAVAYVDDNDLVTDGEDAKKNMISIIEIYNDLHTASGGNIQEEKSKFFAWRWR